MVAKMATDTTTALPARRLFNVDEYLAMGEAGILTRGDGIELLDGQLFCKYDGSRRRFTVAEYYKLAEAGILAPDERVELLAGEIITMPPMGDWHAGCIIGFDELLQESVGRRATKCVQTPLRLSDEYAPLPDLMLLRRRTDTYKSGTPRPDDVLLLIEVADSTADHDRRYKLPAYARFGIPEVWLAVREGHHVEVHAEPVDGVYTRVETIGMGGVLTPTVFPDVAIAVSDVISE